MADAPTGESVRHVETEDPSLQATGTSSAPPPAPPQAPRSAPPSAPPPPAAPVPPVAAICSQAVATQWMIGEGAYERLLGFDQCRRVRPQLGMRAAQHRSA